MAKIDDYKIANGRENHLKELQRAANNPSCDTFGATVKLSDTYEGYYGCSSVSRWSDPQVKAVETALSRMLRRAIDEAVIEAERATERARKEAEAEAHEVLLSTAKV